MQKRATQKRSNKLIVVALSWLFLLSAGSVQAQTQERPKPGPEQKKLAVWVGEWKYEGSAKDSPMGPAVKFVGKQTFRMILDGFFLESRWQDKGSYGGKDAIMQGVYIQWYDTLKKTYVDQGFENDGGTTTTITTVNGNTWTGTSARTAGNGKVYKVKSVNTFSSDGKTCSSKSELSADDGKTWLPWWEATMKKVKK